MLSGPNLPHCWREDPDADAPEWVIAQFDPTCFGPGFLDLPEAMELRALLHAARAGLAFVPGAIADIAPAFRSLVDRKGLARLVGLIDILERLSHYPRTSLAAADYGANQVVNRVMVERLE